MNTARHDKPAGRVLTRGLDKGNRGRGNWKGEGEGEGEREVEGMSEQKTCTRARHEKFYLKVKKKISLEKKRIELLYQTNKKLN